MKEYELRTVVTFRFAASCRPESLGRSNKLMRLMDELEAALRDNGIEMRHETGLPRLVDRERRVRDVLPFEDIPAECAPADGGLTPIALRA